MADVLLMGGYYQFGYLSLEIAAAEDALASRFGIARTRRRKMATMETLHAWTATR